MSNETADDMLGWLDDAMSPEQAVASPCAENKPPTAPSSAHHYHGEKHSNAGAPTSAVAESRQNKSSMYTPQLRGSHATEARDGAVRSHHHQQQHHILPAMSPIVPRKQHGINDNNEEMEDSLMMINSPMGYVDLSTPAIATAGGGGGNNNAAMDMFPPRIEGGATPGAGADNGGNDASSPEMDHEACNNHNDTDTVDANEEALEESEEERRRREEEEQSIELARQLMAEEAMASYHVSNNFLRDNADQYSQEDLAALEAVMAEEDPLAHQDAEDGDEDGEAELSYDAMLRLGEQIGDVKQERWAMVAQKHIDKLPTLAFEPSMAEGKEENHTEVKCQVCQCQYEADEQLRRLPCGHCFHMDCVDQWLKSKDTCCFCKKSICAEE